MSGTSMDGLDLAYVEYCIEGQAWSFELLQVETLPFEPRWQARLAHLPQQSAEVFAKTHVYFGHWLGERIKAFIEGHGLEPDFVAIHGQTIFHQPEKTFTFQIGDGETVAAYLSCPLVSNFRNKDLALGGEGAPLVPLGEELLFPSYRLFLNLGGISNLSYRGRAFDVSPCNAILNEVYQQAFPEADTAYDPKGAVAARGQLDPGLLSALDQLEYYHRKPPKSLGREWTDRTLAPLLEQSPLSPEDMLHTLVIHIAGQIARAVEDLGAQGERMLVTGGGRHHAFLLDEIRRVVAPLAVEVPDLPPEQADWVDYKEALIFGFLGLRTLLGQPTTLARATGAPYDVVSGSIHLPPQGGVALLS